MLRRCHGARDNRQRLPSLEMFNSLSDRLGATLDGLKGRGRLSEDDINKAMREIRLALLEADVNFGVVKAKWGVEQAKAQGRDVVFIDTAGRLHIDEQLMDELVRIRDAVKPHNILLVLDSMSGQDAVTTAQAFSEAVDYDGLILTKLDGDARGGAALAVRAVTGKPIKFVSVGEKLDQLE